MARSKVQFAWIVNRMERKAAYKKRKEALIKKAQELAILCNMVVCLIFFSREDNQLEAWPSTEVAKSLIDRYFSLPAFQRSTRALDQESFIKTNIQKVKKKIEDSQKVIDEIQMDLLVVELQHGLRVDDLSQTQVEKFLAYSDRKIKGFGRVLGFSGQPCPNLNEPFLGDDNPGALDVVPGGSSYTPTGSGPVYLMDQWFMDDPNVQTHGDETHLPRMAPQFNLNVEPSDDDDEDMEVVICKGECSKSGGAEDD